MRLLYNQSSPSLNSKLIAVKAVNAVILAMPGFKKVFGYEYNGELLISATWNALWSAMTFLGMGIGISISYH